MSTWKEREARETALYKENQARMKAMKAPEIVRKIREICVQAQADACGGRESENQCAMAIGAILGLIEKNERCVE